MIHMLLHGHHANDNGCPLSVGNQSLRERKTQIEADKPASEQPIRLALIRNVKPEELPAKARKAWAACSKAWATLNKTRATLDKAYAAYDKAACGKTWATYDKAYAAYDKAAYDKTDATLFASLTPAQWEHWHKKVCKHPDCKWTAEHPSIF